MNFLKETLSMPEFYLPPLFDMTAVFFFALTGALAAMQRGYDLIGLFTMAFATGLGGGLIRDGLFLQTGPPALTKHWGYLIAVLGGCVFGWLLGSLVERFRKVIAVLDAVGLGVYSVVGVAKSLAAGLGIPAAIIVGVINACGGGLLRDIIVREEPLMLKPGQFYVVASLLGSCLFVVLTHYTTLAVSAAAFAAIGATFLFRILAIAFNWRTRAIQPLLFEVPEDSGKKPSPEPPEAKPEQ